MKSFFLSTYIPLCLLIVFSILGCSEEGEVCSALDITCDRKADAKLTVRSPQIIGDTLEFSAEESIFDELQWFINDTHIAECDNDDTCSYTFLEEGTYHVKIVASVKAFYGIVQIPASKDSKEVEFQVIYPPEYTANDEQRCRAQAQLLGYYVAFEEGECIIMKTFDSAKCRYHDLHSCVTPEDAQALCTGDWRLPKATEWKKIRTSTNQATDNMGMCIVESGNCDSKDNSYPNRYVLQETYPDNKGVGSFVEYTFIFFGAEKDYEGHIRKSKLDRKYSVRCFRTLSL